jgi:hypothetical protein
MIQVELEEGELRAVLAVLDPLIPGTDADSDLGNAEFKLDAALLEYERRLQSHPGVNPPQI